MSVATTRNVSGAGLLGATTVGPLQWRPQCLMTDSSDNSLLSVTGFWNAGHVTGTTGFVTLLVVGDLHILAGDGRTCRSGFT